MRLTIDYTTVSTLMMAETLSHRPVIARGRGMIDTQHWHRRGQFVGGIVRNTFRRGYSRPACPICRNGRAVGIVRIEIEELPGLPLVELRDWQCRTCHTLVQETVSPG